MNISFLYGFILGCLTTIIFSYGIKKLATNGKGHSERVKNKKIELEQLFMQHPDFMNKLKSDIDNPEYASIREFLVVDKNAILNASIPRFRYELSEDILPVLNKLEALNYIQSFKNNCLHYKMEEDFVIYMQRHIIELHFA